jgi:hypothetical protein
LAATLDLKFIGDVTDNSVLLCSSIVCLMGGPIEERSCDDVISERALSVILVGLLQQLCLSIRFRDYLQVQATVSLSSSLHFVGSADHNLNMLALFNIPLLHSLDVLELALVLFFVLLTSIDSLFEFILMSALGNLV